MEDKKIIRWRNTKKIYKTSNGVNSSGLKLTIWDNSPILPRGMSDRYRGARLTINNINSRGNLSSTFISVPVEIIPALARTFNAWMLNNKVDNPETIITIVDKI